MRVLGPRGLVMELRNPKSRTERVLERTQRCSPGEDRKQDAGSRKQGTYKGRKGRDE